MKSIVTEREGLKWVRRAVADGSVEIGGGGSTGRVNLSRAVHIFSALPFKTRSGMSGRPGVVSINAPSSIDTFGFRDDAGLCNDNKLFTWRWEAGSRFDPERFRSKRYDRSASIAKVRRTNKRQCTARRLTPRGGVRLHRSRYGPAVDYQKSLSAIGDLVRSKQPSPSRPQCT